MLEKRHLWIFQVRYIYYRLSTSTKLLFEICKTTNYSPLHFACSQLLSVLVVFDWAMLTGACRILQLGLMKHMRRLTTLSVRMLMAYLFSPYHSNFWFLSSSAPKAMKIGMKIMFTKIWIGWSKIAIFRDFKLLENIFTINQII